MYKRKKVFKNIMISMGISWNIWAKKPTVHPYLIYENKGLNFIDKVLETYTFSM